MLPAPADRRTIVDATRIVVVTFNPDLARLEQQFTVAAADGIGVVVIDNASLDVDQLSGLAERYGCDLIRLSANVGIAGAQNIGIERVRSLGGQHVVFYDDDTVPSPGAVHHLADAYLAVQPARVAAIGSRFVAGETLTPWAFRRYRWFRYERVTCTNMTKHDPHPVDVLISSGMFIPLATIDEVGAMSEALFIDLVDTDWCLRAQQLGYQSFGSCAATMSHAIGRRSIRVWVLRWRTMGVHDPERYFYMVRNRLWLYRQTYTSLKWVTADVGDSLKLLAPIFVHRPRSKKLAAAFRGLVAGLGPSMRSD